MFQKFVSQLSNLTFSKYCTTLNGATFSPTFSYYLQASRYKYTSFITLLEGLQQLTSRLLMSQQKNKMYKSSHTELAQPCCVASTYYNLARVLALKISFTCRWESVCKHKCFPEKVSSFEDRMSGQLCRSNVRIF